MIIHTPPSHIGGVCGIISHRLIGYYTDIPLMFEVDINIPVGSIIRFRHSTKDVPTIDDRMGKGGQQIMLTEEGAKKVRCNSTITKL